MGADRISHALHTVEWWICRLLRRDRIHCIGQQCCAHPQRDKQALTSSLQSAVPQRARILVADDHEAVRIGIRALIASVNGWAVAGEASAPGPLMDLARRLRFDAVVMDYNMPDEKHRDGLDLIKWLVDQPCAPGVVV
ncbi:hypothetical protein DBR20_15090, partial [Stenotrophomonas sp. HMWF023]